MIVDAHLDIAYNALLNGHNYLGDPPPGYIISKKALTDAGVGLACVTLMCAPESARKMIRNLAGPAGSNPGDLFYRTGRDAALIAQAQIGYYRSVGLELIGDRERLERYVNNWRPGQLAAILILEGADAVVTPAALGEWARSGLRIVGLAWTRTRYAGGTGRPGGVSAAGRKLLGAMRRHRLILDLSHMADRAVADAFDQWHGPVMASHSNARSLVPGDRQITDQTIRAIAERNGMIGISLFAGHLRARGKADIEDVVNQVVHMARITGSTMHLGIGSDLDGGFPVDKAAIRSVSGLSEIAARLRRQFSNEEVEGIMGANWLSFFQRSLPK